MVEEKENWVLEMQRDIFLHDFLPKIIGQKCQAGHKVFRIEGGPSAKGALSVPVRITEDCATAVNHGGPNVVRIMLSEIDQDEKGQYPTIQKILDGFGDFLRKNRSSLLGEEED